MATNTMTTTTQVVQSSKDLAKPQKVTYEARAITTAEWKEAALSLAEAFADDDVSRYFVDTPDRAHWTVEEKWNLHLSIMEYITYAHCLRGLVTTAGPNYGSVALWMPPGNNMDDWYTILRSGMWRLNYKLSAEGKARFFQEFLPLLHDTKHAVLGPRDESSYYLVYVGTRPAARGMGLARKCIDFVTDRADAEGRACYLESSNEVNPVIYGKMGFDTVRKISLKRAEKEVVLDIMVREPVGTTERQKGMNGVGPQKVKLQVSARPKSETGSHEKTGGAGGPKVKAFAVVTTN